MITVGIDQSYTSCGFVALDGDKVLYAEAYASDKTSDIFWRSWTQMLYTIQLVNKWQPKHIAMEGLAFMRFGNATRDLAGLQFVLVTSLRYQHHKDVEVVPPLTLKKFATGNGKAKKDDMVASLPEDVRKSFQEQGFKKTKGLYDVTDAYWLARYTQEKHKLLDAKALKKTPLRPELRSTAV